MSVGSHLSRIGVLVLVCAALVVALGVAAGMAGVGPHGHWQVELSAHPRRTGEFKHPMLTESSGVAASRRQPGIIWTMNDSGHDAYVFAADTMGRDYGAFAVAEAEDRDWESIALGPCGKRDCLYIGDTGDNTQSLDHARIYRVPEPDVSQPIKRTRPAEVLEFRYSGGARDTEAMFVTGDGTVYLIAKDPSGSPPAFRIKPGAWKKDGIATAERVGNLPLDSRGLGRYVTDASIDASGHRVAVRTYLAVYLFALTSRGTLIPSGVACDATGLQLQGEGISWLDDRVLVLTSEGGFGSHGTIVLLECGSSPLDH